MTGPAVVAVLASVSAVLVALPPPARLPRSSWGRSSPAAGTTAERSRRWTRRHGVLLAAAGLLAAAVAPYAGALALVLAGAAAGAAGLVRRQVRRGRRATAAARVLESCEVLAGELASGRTPGQALATAARGWPQLRAAAVASEVGADVPRTLRDLATSVDGADDLRVVAAAWQVAHRTGDGLGSAVERVAETLRGQAATRQLVAGELASARATARLVAGLPVAALGLGSGVGGNPWGFLLGSPAGLACLGGGLAFGLAGLWWIEAIAAEVEEAA